jgi:hypothetical protein
MRVSLSPPFNAMAKLGISYLYISATILSNHSRDRDADKMVRERPDAGNGCCEHVESLPTFSRIHRLLYIERVGWIAGGGRTLSIDAASLFKDGGMK